MSTTVKAVTARKQHPCDTDYPGGGHVITPGHRYLRHTAFPGDDVNPTDRPWTLTECVACACRRNDGELLLITTVCLTFCCGDVPCARPVRHDGHHSCQRCARRGQEDPR